MPVIPMGIEFKTRSPRFRCETVVVVQESKVMSRNAKKAQLATLWDSQEINRFLCQTWLILECTWVNHDHEWPVPPVIMPWYYGIMMYHDVSCSKMWRTGLQLQELQAHSTSTLSSWRKSCLDASQISAFTWCRAASLPSDFLENKIENCQVVQSTTPIPQLFSEKPVNLFWTGIQASPPMVQLKSYDFKCTVGNLLCDDTWINVKREVVVGCSIMFQIYKPTVPRRAFAHL